ncbi:CDP-alcohol phosphatidyltransferase family protein [Acidisoma cellulosilytica]|uniref:CDP-alcohol phosphatidyltransferase family protein n=1 Tax=Acidisoma cellulosilyticum TaxID=2802395 RepID=A0A964E430_9PROT|nr:CDP-alcohol phosphatidyltransferase family protein [Acidisoma cellulosilyticum]MCB8881054.1 CDP-alcohol phosphatidyltransferase family protein [Acidisoma cellulosilyticum]
MATLLLPLFVRWGVTPNLVSLSGMACGLIAGFAYSHVPAPAWVLAGFLLMLAWHVMDGADGQLARLTNAQSEFGKVLDGICDYITFIAVYIGLAVALTPRDGVWIWLLVALAGACHAAQSAAYEAQRQLYDVWGWGRVSRRLHVATPEAARSVTGMLHHLYGRMQVLLLGRGIETDARLRTLLQTAPDSAGELHRRYRETFAPVVRRWSVMCSNYRTVGIFLFALAGCPIGYFLTEIVLLSAVSFWLIDRQNRRLADFLRQVTVEGVSGPVVLVSG